MPTQSTMRSYKSYKNYSQAIFRIFLNKFLTIPKQKSGFGWRSTIRLQKSLRIWEMWKIPSWQTNIFAHVNPFRYDLIMKNCGKIYIERCSSQLLPKTKSYKLKIISPRLVPRNSNGKQYVIAISNTSISNKCCQIQ